MDNTGKSKLDFFISNIMTVHSLHSNYIMIFPLLSISASTHKPSQHFKQNDSSLNPLLIVKRYIKSNPIWISICEKPFDWWKLLRDFPVQVVNYFCIIALPFGKVSKGCFSICECVTFRWLQTSFKIYARPLKKPKCFGGERRLRIGWTRDFLWITNIVH